MDSNLQEWYVENILKDKKKFRIEETERIVMDSGEWGWYWDMTTFQLESV